ncbi:hypothetical protein LJB89_00740, partial [Tyzzerella sp. OttesenSCG-928-J15]|nr:hypothetical protein [Tyzzerella sp. OttesenSCG-928-J15]
MAKEYDYMELEKAAIKAVPALEEITLDGWLMRFSAGFRNRWNCVIPFENFDDAEGKIEKCEAEFGQRNIAPCFKILQSTHPKISSILENRKYDVSNRHIVYTRELDSFVSKPFLQNVIHHNEAITGEWLDAYTELVNVPPSSKEGVDELYSKIKNRLISAYYISNEKIAGTSLGVLVDDYVIISCTTVKPSLRSREADKALFNKVLERAQAMGAKTAVVHALSSDLHSRDIYRGQ